MTENASSPSCLPGTRCPFAQPAMVDHATPERSATAIFCGLRIRPTSRLACSGGGRNATSQPVGLPHENTPQGLTAQDATELLQRGAPVAGEAHVTARPVAAKFFAGLGLVIALARALVRRLCSLSMDGAAAPASRLLTAIAPTLVAGAIALIGSPPRPSAGRLPAGSATVSRERIVGLEPPLTAFQQAPALSATRWGLLGRRMGILWSWAQGRYCSRRSSLGAKRQLRTEASLCAVTCCWRRLGRIAPLYRWHRD